MNTELAADAPEIAGFWRRLGAFLIDVLLLGVTAAIMGAFLFDFFVSLGVWGRLVGFVIGLLYFGLLNSSIGDGQTVGKRLLKIKVVGADGKALPLSKSMLRFSIFGTAWFLNGAPFPLNVLNSPAMYLLSLAIFGIGLAVIYLVIFNRTTRQSLHDLAVNSYVVRAEPSGPPMAAPLWRVHLIIVVTFFILAAAAPAFTTHLVKTEMFAGLMKATEAVNAAPEVTHASVNKGWTAGSNGKSTYLQLTAYLAKPQTTDAALAKRLAKAALTADPSSMQVDTVQVVLVYGYDIGIASGSRTQSYNDSPATWIK